MGVRITKNYTVRLVTTALLAVFSYHLWLFALVTDAPFVQLVLLIPLAVLFSSWFVIGMLVCMSQESASALRVPLFLARVSYKWISVIAMMCVMVLPLMVVAIILWTILVRIVGFNAEVSNFISWLIAAMLHTYCGSRLVLYVGKWLDYGKPISEHSKEVKDASAFCTPQNMRRIAFGILTTVYLLATLERLGEFVFESFPYWDTMKGAALETLLAYVVIDTLIQTFKK